MPLTSEEFTRCRLGIGELRTLYMSWVEGELFPVPDYESRGRKVREQEETEDPNFRIEFTQQIKFGETIVSLAHYFQIIDMEIEGGPEENLRRLRVFLKAFSKEYTEKFQSTVGK